MIHKLVSKFKGRSQSSQMKMTPVPLHGEFSWGKHIMKRHPHMLDSSFTMSGLLEQINTTRDVTDDLCYSTAYSNGLILLVSSAITYHSSCLIMFAFSVIRQLLLMGVQT
ncbi:hypothetical protein Q3G72_017992 [Acer saccharum]|nr:hypothetical protein Q3G72_017992 [Acer saccharum]